MTPLPTNGPAIAETCRRAGFRPVPLTPPVQGDRDSGKRPRGDGWWARADQPRDPFEFEGCNVGIACGYPLPDGGYLLVLDPDGDEGVAQLQALAAQHGGLPETLTVRSGSGVGYHLYYRTREPLRGRKLASKIDTRARGGQVVAPGNYHHSGGMYEVVHSAPIAQAPEWVEKLLTQGGATISKSWAPDLNLKIRTDADRQHAAMALQTWLAECQTRTPDPDAPRREWYSLGARRLGAMADVLGGADAVWRQIEGGVLAWCAKRDAYGKPDSRSNTDLLQRARRSFEEGLRDPGFVDEELATAAEVHALTGGVPAQVSQALGFKFNDPGFAARFAHQHGHVARYVSKQGWYAYDGTRWVCSAEKPTHLVTAMLESIQREAVSKGDEDLEKAVTPFLSCSKIVGICTLAARLLPARIEDFDAHPELLNVRNGTVDLRTGDLRPHSAADALTRMAAVPFDAAAACPRWERALLLYLNEDAHAVRYLQRLLGAGLIGRALDVMHFFLGRGLNGKSVVVKAAMGVLGTYACAISPDAICKRRDGAGRHTSELGSKIGTRLMLAEELRDGAKVDMEAVKRLGGKQNMQTGMGRDFVDAQLTNTLIVTSNHTPSISDTSKGALRRVRVLPFSVDLEARGVAPDITFAEKLLAHEGSGILAWLVAGARAYLAEGLGSCAMVDAATAELNAENDLVQEWIDDCCALDPVADTAVASLLQSYESWCRLRGQTPLHRSTFSEKLKHKGFEAIRAGKHRVRGRRGLVLLPVGAGRA